MPVQRISRCKFRVGGSYTNNVVNLNVVTHSYNGRAHHTSSRTALLPAPESLSNLVLEAERLQRTARDLSNELRLTASSEIEYNDLVTTLNEIADETTPYIFQCSLNDHQRDIRGQHRILLEVASMQRTLDDFVKRRTTDQDHATRRVRSIIAADAIIDLLWSHVRWLFYPQYPTSNIVESLTTSRDIIYSLLFKAMASSIGKRIRCHQIDIDDFFGAQWSLPQDLCLNRQVFYSILRLKFQGGPAELVIMSEQFGIFRQDGLRAIQEGNWEKVIKNGDGLQLSVFVNRPHEDMADDLDVPECPQCGQSDKTIPGGSSNGWVTCLRCDSTFNVTSLDPGEHYVNGRGDRDPSSLSPSFVDYISTFRCFSITRPSNPVGGPSVKSWPPWPPALERRKFHIAYKTYLARTGMEHDMRLMHMDGKPIDLHALHVNVMQEGGWAKVHNHELWNVIGGRLGFILVPGSDSKPARSGSPVAHRLAQVYKEYLSGFDHVYIQAVIESRKKMQADLDAMEHEA